MILLGIILIILAIGALAMWKLRRKNREKISLLVPFRTDHAERERTWLWLYDYYVFNMPEGTEIIVESNEDTPFCKTNAVNKAFRKSTGDVVVILDADCYIDTDVIVEAAGKIRAARKQGKKLWFIPYRRFYRMHKHPSLEVLGSLPWKPLHLSDPPPRGTYYEIHKGAVSAGHWWGALIQIMPREAFARTGGMDERFRGWGGEDISFMHAVDTLYGPHKTLNDPVYHLWHPTIGGKFKGSRQWADQDKAEMNDNLAHVYETRRGDRKRMKRLTRGERY